VSQRMEAFQCCPPFEEFFTGHFYRDHPEYRCVDQDGREIARLSYAFAEVRELVLSIFRELTTEYDIDGINPLEVLCPVHGGKWFVAIHAAPSWSATRFWPKVGRWRSSQLFHLCRDLFQNRIDILEVDNATLFCFPDSNF